MASGNKCLFVVTDDGARIVHSQRLLRFRASDDEDDDDEGGVIPGGGGMSWPCTEDCTPAEPTLLVALIESLDLRNLLRYCALYACFTAPMRPPPDAAGDSIELKGSSFNYRFPNCTPSMLSEEHGNFSTTPDSTPKSTPKILLLEIFL